MTDSTTRRPIRVSTDGTSGPYIMVPVELLEKVRKLLLENDVSHWVDHNALCRRASGGHCDQPRSEGGFPSGSGFARRSTRDSIRCRRKRRRSRTQGRKIGRLANVSNALDSRIDPALVPG